MQISIEEINGEQKQPLLESLRILQNEIFTHAKWTTNGFEKFFANDKRSPLCFVVLADGEPVGFIMGRISKENKFTVELFGVSNKMRGEGIGKMLMTKFLEKAISREKEIIVHFRSANPVQKFYEKIGFANLKICGKYKNGEDKCEMSISF
jgi:ribosomal protein S18 acetylase RimI-like enzyme